MLVHNGDIALHVDEDGDPTGPDVLLLHGITSSSRTWDWLVPTLADRFRVLRLDFRGHGRSDRAPGRYGSTDYVSDAAAVLEQTAGGPCVVIGHSLGGVTAAALAQSRTDLVSGVVLEDPPLGPTDSSARMSLEGNSLLDGFRMMRQSIPQLQAAKMSVPSLAGILASAPDTTRRSTFGERLHADGIESMAAAMLDVDATVLDAVLTGSISAFLDPTIGFRVPTTIIAGDPAMPDTAAHPTAIEHYAGLSDDCAVLTVAGAGHLIHDELQSRDSVRSTVLAFLERVSS